MSCHVVLYVRKSHEETDRQVLSLDAQEKECRAYADRQHLTISELIQEAHSARRPGRPLFTEMLKQIETKLQQGIAVKVLAHKPDRLLRNIGDWAKLNDLMDAGLELLFVTGSYENNAHGRLAFGVNVVFAKFYVDNLSEEVRKGLKEKLARGEWPGWAPIGYQNVKDRHSRQRIVVDPVSGPLIVKAFEYYATGEYSLANLTGKLADLGLVGRLVGKPLSKSILRERVLSNPFYCGLFRYKGEVYSGTHEPLITVSLFEQVQAVLSGRAQPKRSRHDFRFGGLFHCSRCGCAVVGDIKKQRYIYYRCSHRRGSCQEPYIREEWLEDRLRQRTEELLVLAPEIEKSLREAAETMAGDDTEDVRRQALEQRQQAIGNRLAVLLDLRLAGHVTQDQYLAKQDELVHERVLVEKEVEAFEFPAADPREAVEWFISTCNTFNSLLAGAESAEARELLRIVGSNYCCGAGKVDFKPVAPFTLASQARNRPTWRGDQHEVRTAVDSITLRYLDKKDTGPLAGWSEEACRMWNEKFIWVEENRKKKS